MRNAEERARCRDGFERGNRGSDRPPDSPPPLLSSTLVVQTTPLLLNMEGVLLHRLIRPENQRNLLHVRRLYVALAHPDDVDTNELDEFVRGAVGPREVFLRYDTQGLNSLQGSSEFRRTFLFRPSEPSLEARLQMSRHSTSRTSLSTRALPFRYLI